MNKATDKLPPLPKGYTRTYSQVFDAAGRVVLSKWWMTASYRDALKRETAIKGQRMAVARAARAAARQPNEVREAISGRLCGDCQKVAVDYKRTYCGKCSAARKREADRQAQRRKRGLDVRNPVFSPFQTEALTYAVLSDGCPDPQNARFLTNTPLNEEAL
jgi:hypothetical protein